MAWTGLLVGLVFGIILQRGRVCFNSAFRDVLLFKDNYLWKLGFLAVGLQMITVLFVAQMGWIRIAPPTLNLFGNIVGAYVFGLGMVLAGGCASGVTYRSGEGMTTAMIAAVFYGIGAMAMRGGVFSPIRTWASQFNVSVDANSSVYLDKVGPTLATVLNINPWIPAVILAAVLLWYTLGTKTTERKTKFNWKVAAVSLAILSPIAWITSEAAGRNYGFGITGGWVSIFDSYISNQPLRWDGFEIIGIILGALIASLLAKEFKLRMPKNPKTYLVVMIGGTMMGAGASLAGGCNIGHFLAGLPTLAISSIIASVFLILGNWTMAYILYRK
ncbi:MAG: YeeE/YedE family protein [Kosmotogaceae bacterium]|nr:YeeE/YedE family protein [Kosmotogaceae bacterium]